VVSHRWLLQVREPEIKASHLSCAASAIVHSKGIVKVHGVFPSSCGQPASSPALQVRRASWQDSRTFVTPFVQVGTYPTRNFAQVCYASLPQRLKPRWGWFLAARLKPCPFKTYGEEWTFLPLSACRHAVRTLSFPTQVRVGIWLVVSEDSGKMVAKPQGLKPHQFCRPCGTAEAVPFHKPRACARDLCLADLSC
jgi:hypothetical protein